MNKMHILDCTLRDGGYCNQWKFGFKNTQKIVQSLIEANINIIECGFLTNQIEYDANVSKYTTLEEIKRILPGKNGEKMFVVMMNYGEYDVDDLPVCDGDSIDGVRVAFHKKDLDEALKVCKRLKEKGYKVFVQPMVSLGYTDEEFLSLINKVNEFMPYAFYIVDSFGMMKKKNLMRLFYMVEHNLNESIWIGFHSHNNMQLAYSNAQNLVEAQTSRNLIIDSSIYGMGRGAGNLNTELFVEYLNENIGTTYVLKPLLNVIDEILNEFYQTNSWGYSLPNYLSAVYSVHPNYANYLSEKNTLTVEAMDEIFCMMNQEKKYEYDKNYIENLYLQYMETGKSQEIHRDELQQFIQGKEVLLIAPGKSSEEEKEKIAQYAKQKNVIAVSINFDYQHVETKYIFLSNLRRFKELEMDKKNKCIVTSNIPADGVYLQTKYFELLTKEDTVKDNAGMMAIRFFINMGTKKIVLAGFDGYSHDVQKNYALPQMTFATKNTLVDMLNEGMCKVLQEYRKEIEIEFLTTQKYVKIL